MAGLENIPLGLGQGGLAHTSILNQTGLFTRHGWSRFLIAQSQADENISVRSGKQILKRILPQMDLEMANFFFQTCQSAGYVSLFPPF